MSAINILRAKFGSSANLLLPFAGPDDIPYTSAVIENHLGYADYNDTSTSASPLSLSAGVWTDLPNDGLGSFSQEAYLPQGCPTLLGAGGSIDLSGLPLGSKIFIRPDFRVTPNVNNAALKFRYKLGSGADVVERSPPQMETVRSVWGEGFESEVGLLPKP